MAGVAAQTAIAMDKARLIGQEQRASRAKDAIYGWAHILRSGRITGEKRRTRSTPSVRNANVQIQLIDDMLDVSR